LTQIIKGKRRVIGYASKTLTDSQKKYSIYQKECFAIIWGTEVNRHFLQSSKGGWKCVTDNKAATWLLKQKNTTLIKWINMLEEYPGMSIIHRPGKDNLVDFMTRLPSPTGDSDYPTRYIPELCAIDGDVISNKLDEVAKHQEIIDYYVRPTLPILLSVSAAATTRSATRSSTEHLPDVHVVDQQPHVVPAPPTPPMPPIQVQVQPTTVPVPPVPAVDEVPIGV
jgi:hypothetical protein